MSKNEYLELMQDMFSKNKEEINQMYNSGMFNEITEGYLVKVLQNLNSSKELIEKAVTELHHCQDRYTAGEIRVGDNYMITAP